MTGQAECLGAPLSPQGDVPKTSTPGPVARIILVGIALVVLLQPGWSVADIILDASNSGFYNDVGNQQFGNYIVGRLTIPSQVSNDYFVFDLTGVKGNISSATLKLTNPTDGYSSQDLNETFTIFNVATPIGTLLKPGGLMPGIFLDLGSGTSYGSGTVSAADNGKTLSFGFNANGIQALNAAEGMKLAIGGSLTSLSTRTDNEYAFAYSGSGGEVRQLVITTTPEPSTLASMSLGALGLVLLKRVHGKR
jgi:PEP-CTERM motif